MHMENKLYNIQIFIVNVDQTLSCSFLRPCARSKFQDEGHSKRKWVLRGGKVTYQSERNWTVNNKSNLCKSLKVVLKTGLDFLFDLYMF